MIDGKSPDVFGAPGITLGTRAAIEEGGLASWAMLGSYAPTPIELIIVLGVVSLVVLAFMVLTRRFVGGSGKDASIPARTATDQAA